MKAFFKKIQKYILDANVFDYESLGIRQNTTETIVYTTRRFGGRRGNKVRYCCSKLDRRLPACGEANPGPGVCSTEVIMAVNLDKEAYYRRIKRLYSNWKVKKMSNCQVCVNPHTPIIRRVEKV